LWITAPTKKDNHSHQNKEEKLLLTDDSGLQGVQPHAFEGCYITKIDCHFLHCLHGYLKTSFQLHRLSVITWLTNGERSASFEAPIQDCSFGVKGDWLVLS
jgi:hypothetical protein